MRSTTPERENLAFRTSEAWQPPSFIPVDNRRARVTAAVRRFLDIPAGSIWRDLKTVLPDAQGVVVDAGCGAQPYRGLLPSTTEYIGLDTADALEHFGYEMPDVRTIAADGSWPVEDASADLVLATETLEHVPEPAAFLTEVMRVLRPGGKVVMTVPFAARWHYIPHDYWRYTPSSLRLLLEGAGFEDILVWGRGNEVTVACYKLNALILAAVLPQERTGKVRLRVAGLLFSPLLLISALIANRSLRGRTGDDCIGYTVFARRRVEQ